MPAFGSISSTTWAARTNTTITAPSGIADGDRLVLIQLTGTSGEAPDPSPPAGFTLLSGPTWPVEITEFAFNIEARVYEKTAASESGDYTVTHTNCESQGVIVRVTSPGAFNPAMSSNIGVNFTTTATGLTVAANSYVMFVAWDFLQSANDITAPTGTTPTFTERLDGGTSDLYVADGVYVAGGATGDKTITNRNTDPIAPWGALLIAVEPAAGAGPAGLTADPSMLAGFFIRNQRQLSLWEGSPGASFTSVTGVADASFGGTFTAAGNIIEPGAAVASFGGTFTALGVDRALGAAVASFGFTATALGVVGTPAVTGQAVASFGGTFTAAGVPRTSGAATATFGGTFTALGVDRAVGVAVASFGFTATAAGIDRAVGQAVASFGFTATAAGVDRAVGVAVASFGFTATATGFAGTPPVTGQAVATFGGSFTALGVDRAVGVAVATFGFMATSSGHQLRTGQATAAFGFTATALGRPRVHGQASAAFGFVAAIFIITYQVRLVSVGGNRYTAVAINRYTGAADGPRYSVED